MSFLRHPFNRLLVPSNRSASTMVMERSRMSGDREHPTGFYRDGYCWGSEQDRGKHYIGAVVTSQFLEFSRDRGNDLVSRRPGFVGLTPGCRWCLCVQRWKEALAASLTLGENVVPRIDMAATALDTLKDVDMVDLERFRWQADPDSEETSAPQTQGGAQTTGT